jgi:hypothetical protein
MKENIGDQPGQPQEDLEDQDNDCLGCLALHSGGGAFGVVNDVVSHEPLCT